MDTITPYGVVNNKEEPIGLNTLKQRMKLTKVFGIMDSILILPDEDQKKSKLKALVSVMKKEGIDLRDYSMIRFYKTTFSTEPGKANDLPVSKGLLAEIKV